MDKLPTCEPLAGEMDALFPADQIFSAPPPSVELQAFRNKFRTGAAFTEEELVAIKFSGKAFSQARAAQKNAQRSSQDAKNNPDGRPTSGAIAGLKEYLPQAA